jgi:molecular chaperone GrpE
MTEPLPTAKENEQEQAQSTASGDTAPDRLAALEQQLAKAQESHRYATEQWKRCEADLQNYRKRIEKERAEWIQSSLAALVRSLLPVLDDLDRAFQTLPPTLSQLTWTDGLALVDRKLVVTLEQQGLKEIDALGKPFDPARHQGLSEGESKGLPDGSVMAVLQKGYLFNDRVLRPALVQISRRSQSAETVSQTDVEQPSAASDVKSDDDK